MAESYQRLNRLGVVNDPKPYYGNRPLPFTGVNDMSRNIRPRPVLYGTFLTSFVRRDL